MDRKPQLAALKLSLAVALLATGLTADALADPIFGRDQRKFSQRPMINTTIPDVNGTVNTYFGHDELSTAYGFGQPLYQGRFMADDFADKLTSPVLHVKWWGSYINAAGPQNPNMPLNRFLISFESDVPAGPAPSFSHPGQPLLNQVVARGLLAPGSGTFTEKLIRGPDPILGEALYEYNAELHLGKDFKEIKDTVYWLKVVALVDSLPGLTFDPYNPQSSPIPVTQWGWHNRDYTIQDTLASATVAPGEFIEGFVGAGVPVWHFQDDAVRGDVRITPSAAGGMQMPFVDQQNMVPQLYLDNIDGPGFAIPGTHNIGSLSKDLAFELYTYAIPEPASCLLMVIGLAGLVTRRRPALDR